MAERSKASLDRLFQKGLEPPQHEYNPAAWDNMVRLLQRRQRRKRLLWFWLVIALGIGGLASNYWLRQKKLLTFWNPPLQQNSTHWEAAPEDWRVFPDSANEKTERLVPFSLLAPRPAATSGRATSARRQSSGSSLPPVAPPNRPVAPAAPGVMPPAQSLMAPTAALRPAATTQVQPESSISAFDQRTSPPIDSFAASAAAPLRGLDLSLLAARPAKVLSDSAISALPPLPPSWSKIPPTRGFNLFILVGMEQNAVGRGDFDSLGQRAGLGIEYRFAHHWSVGLGLQYAKRNYVAESGEYQAPPGYWRDAVAPVATRGHCKMLEVPLQLIFYPHHYQKGGWLLSAGLQNYWVLKEYYRYQYEKSVPNQRLRWKGQNTDQTYLGFLQFGCGYQAPLYGQFWLDVQPYWQIPLQGMGHGQLNLQSVGVNLRLKWLGR